jgi:DNA-binding winged helix-turn-helix (wHTH) protein
LSLKFGEFVLDPGSRQLRRGAEERHLGPKAFDLLELLLARRPNVVSKQSIRDHLWPGTFVTGSTLATVVAEIREALQDDPKEPRFLRTVHGLGYAFSGEAAEARGKDVQKAPIGAVTYRLLFEGREVSLRAGENVLGRVDEGAVWIDSPSVSRRHARILVAATGATIEDLGSKNGTWCRGERITGAVPLVDEQEFRLGQVSLKLRVLPVDASTRTDEAR